MTFTVPWVVVLVIAAVFLALHAGGSHRRPLGVVLAVLLLVVGVGTLASMRPRSVTTPRRAARSSSTRPAALVEVKDGRLVIRADALRQYLPPEITIPRPPALPLPVVVPPEAATAPAPQWPPQSPPLDTDSEDAKEALAAAIERYFDQVLEEQIQPRLDHFDLRPWLARLKSDERRRLANEVARREGESARTPAGVTSPKTSRTVETYTLQLDGDPTRWHSLAAVGETPSASRRAPPLIVRLVLLIGTIVVAAAVLRSSISRPGSKARPAAKS